MTSPKTTVCIPHRERLTARHAASTAHHQSYIAGGCRKTAMWDAWSSLRDLGYAPFNRADSTSLEVTCCGMTLSLQWSDFLNGYDYAGSDHDVAAVIANSVTAANAQTLSFTTNGRPTQASVSVVTAAVEALGLTVSWIESHPHWAQRFVVSFADVQLALCWSGKAWEVIKVPPFADPLANADGYAGCW